MENSIHFDAIDTNSFIIEFDVNNIKGGILKKYLSKDSFKKTIATINSPL